MTRQVKFFLVFAAIGLSLSACQNQKNDDFENTTDSSPFNAAFIIMDKSQPAYRVFTSVSKNSSNKQIAELEEFVNDNEFILKLETEDFYNNIEDHTFAGIVENQYQSEIISGNLQDFLEKNFNTPIGITWNGGISFTFNDYQEAEQKYQDYLDNPQEYLAKPLPSLKMDPHHPLNHFPPLTEN